MSRNVSGRENSPSFAESAIEIVRNLVAAHRGNGVKTHAALELMAPELETSTRRLRHLFERDREGFVGVNEYERLLLRGARVLRRIARRHHELAVLAEEKAALMEEKFLNLEGIGDCASESGSGGESPRRAA